VSYASGAAEFVDRLALGPGDVVLDAASETGNLAIPAARTGASVIGIDIAPNLVEAAHARWRGRRRVPVHCVPACRWLSRDAPDESVILGLA
jgi:2-polyprenyl-3-methyl-5-hydroxy-6-metoxy-1,4-benzoquinol methylase